MTLVLLLYQPVDGSLVTLIIPAVRDTVANPAAPPWSRRTSLCTAAGARGARAWRGTPAASTARRAAALPTARTECFDQGPAHWLVGMLLGQECSLEVIEGPGKEKVHANSYSIMKNMLLVFDKNYFCIGTQI